MSIRYCNCFTAGVLILLLLPLAAGCGSGQASTPTDTPPGEETTAEETTLVGLADPDAIIANPDSLPPVQPREDQHPEVLITTNRGDLRVRLDAANASETVDNFLENYVDNAFYEGTVFHYVEAGFIVMGGGYTSDLEPKEVRAPIRNEAHNGLQNRRGTIAMSRQADYIDSATSQFFFNLTDNPSLDHDPSGGDEGYGYCVFGEVTEGLEVLDQIAEEETHTVGEFQNVPVEPVVVTSIRLLR